MMSSWKPKAEKHEDEGHNDADRYGNDDDDDDCFNVGINPGAYKHNALSRYQVSKTERAKKE